MNMGYFSSYFYFLKIISTMSYSFQSTSCVLYRFIQTYFIYVDAIVNGVFLISLSDYSLQVCRNTIDFCVLILQPATFFNLIIWPNKLLSISSV